MSAHYVKAWEPWLIVASIGSAIIALGIAALAIQLYVSIKNRAALRDDTGDPWDGRTLEWMTTSPPPVYNFAVLPDVSHEEAYWSIKEGAREKQRLTERPEYEPIEMPRNSPTGFITAFFTTVLGFAAVWHIWWLVILGTLGAWATFTVFAWRDHHEFEIPADEVERLDRDRRDAKADLLGLPREVVA